MRRRFRSPPTPTPTPTPTDAETPTSGSGEYIVAIDETQLVLRRAIQLAGDQVAVAEGMPVRSMAEVAAELHLPVRALADALAEHRAGVLKNLAESGQIDEGVMERLVGPSMISVRHRSGIDDQEVLTNLDTWLNRHYGLRTRVNSEGAVVAVQPRGLVPNALRWVRIASGGGGLAKVAELRGAAVTAEPGRTSICLVADVRPQRKQSVVEGSLVAASGVAAASVGFFLAAPVTLIGVPVSLGAGWVVTRVGFRYRVRQITDEVEIAADNVAAGASPPTLRRLLADRIGFGARGRDT